MDIREITPEERRELQDFEERLHRGNPGMLQKLNDLPDDVRGDTWIELRQRFRQYENAITEREGKRPDFDDPAIQLKHKDLVKSLHLDADQIARKALETQRAKDLADQLKAREAAAGIDRDRER